MALVWWVCIKTRKRKGRHPVPSDSDFSISNAATAAACLDYWCSWCRTCQSTMVQVFLPSAFLSGQLPSRPQNTCKFSAMQAGACPQHNPILPTLPKGTHHWGAFTNHSFLPPTGPAYIYKGPSSIFSHSELPIFISSHKHQTQLSQQHYHYFIKTSIVLLLFFLAFQIPQLAFIFTRLLSFTATPQAQPLPTPRHNAVLHHQDCPPACRRCPSRLRDDALLGSSRLHPWQGCP